MYIQFKTISIGSLVISYFAIMGICLLLYLGFKIIIPAVLFLFLPVLLYFLFRGEVELKTTGDKFLVTWIKKPLFHSQKDSAINLNEVIRWKHERSFRGPESFTIILKNGKQLKFRPAMFSLRDWQSELWKEFDITMRKFQSNTSKEELYNRIAYSGYMAKLNKEGNSIGAKITVIAINVPVGLGEPVFDRLDADIAKALMSINAVKGVEIGAGFNSVIQKGSEHRDEITADGFLSNHAGGVLGGISTGQDIVATLALKPTSSIRLPGRSLTTSGEETEVITTGRHDPCVGIRATPIAEAMLALTLMDHFLRDRGQIGKR